MMARFTVFYHSHHSGVIERPLEAASPDEATRLAVARMPSFAERVEVFGLSMVGSFECPAEQVLTSPSTDDGEAA